MCASSASIRRHRSWQLIASKPIPVMEAGRYLLSLSDHVIATDSRLPLDGEYADASGQTMSGDSVPGGDFQFRFDVLPGDAANSGNVVAGDVSVLASAFGSFAGGTDGRYSPFVDFDGSGNVVAGDVSILASNFGRFLPSDAPVLTENRGTVTEGTDIHATRDPQRLEMAASAPPRTPLSDTALQKPAGSAQALTPSPTSHASPVDNGAAGHSQTQHVSRARAAEHAATSKQHSSPERQGNGVVSRRFAAIQRSARSDQAVDTNRTQTVPPELGCTRIDISARPHATPLYSLHVLPRPRHVDRAAGDVEAVSGQRMSRERCTPATRFPIRAATVAPIRDQATATFSDELRVLNPPHASLNEILHDRLADEWHNDRRAWADLVDEALKSDDLF